jgi:threonine synthase
MNFELNRRNENLTILGATSGDTGSSAEAAFKGLDRVELFMLSPEVGMSDFQKAQMGTLSGGNINNISVKGRFDDCQDLVKLLKSDPEFANLGAVNSIN